MTVVPYRVEARARRTLSGWELLLGNGETLHVRTLDHAARHIRAYLDGHQPDRDHSVLDVAVVVSSEQCPLTFLAEYPAAVPRPAPRLARQTQSRRSNGGRHRL